MSAPDFSTVLLVSSKQTRTISINPRLLFIIKPLLAVLVLIVVLLGAAVTALGMRYWSARQQYASNTRQLQQQVTDLQNFTSVEIKAKVAALKRSEQMVLDLQQYLNARGINIKPITVTPRAGQPNPAAGGPIIPVAAQPVPFTGSFADDAQTLLQALQRTPLGAPHPGSISSPFGLRPNPFTGRGAEFHGGIDFRGNTGDPVRATANGKVAFAGVQNGYGNVVRLTHGNGYETVFGHLSKINVQTGDVVQAGDLVGLVGSTGRSTGPHLHYEVLRKGERLNPERFLSLKTPW